MLSATQQDIDSIRRLEKTNVLSVVAAHKGNDDNLRLLALKVVDRSNSQ
jgi:hypothetical protein